MKKIAKVVSWSIHTRDDVRYFIEEKCFDFMMESVWFDSWVKFNMPFELKPELRAVIDKANRFTSRSNGISYINMKQKFEGI